MTQTEGNKLIAEFMGASIDRYPEHLPDGTYFVGPWESNMPLFLYHSSWDWLMPVVDKIEGLFPNEKKLNVVNICTDRTEIITCWLQEKFNEIVVEDNGSEQKIDFTYRAVVQFIQWYNTLKIKE